MSNNKTCKFQNNKMVIERKNAQLCLESALRFFSDKCRIKVKDGFNFKVKKSANKLYIMTMIELFVMVRAA